MKHTISLFFINALSIVGLLIVLNIISYCYVVSYGFTDADTFFRLFNFNKEYNFPSIFSSVLHFIASILLFAIGLKNIKVKKKFFWISISCIFFYLSLDELLRLPEMAQNYFQFVLPKYFLFSDRWILPNLILVGLLGLFYLKTVFLLPLITRRIFITSALIFISGAIGVEMITNILVDPANFTHNNIHLNPTYFTLYTIEESMEMLGVILFIHGLLDYRKNRFDDFFKD